MSESIEDLKTELADIAKSLNSNHLKFAKGLAQGESQEKAYVNAGYKSKKPAEDASKCISRYPSIAQYRDLFKKITALELLPKEIATLEQKRQMLWDIASKASLLKVTLKDSENEDGIPLEMFDATSAKTAVSAIAELNKMDGHLAAIKMENKITTVDSLIDELLGGAK